jgi:purine catabolism regulator
MSRTANGKLRPAVAAAAPAHAKVLRSRPDLIAAVFEIPVDADGRSEGERLRRRVADEVGDENLSAGVAGPKNGATGAHLALLQAEQSVVVSRAVRGEGRTTHFEDLGPYCFVLGQPEHDIRAFSERILGPLAEDEKHAELVRTLEAYLRLHGSVNAVARALYLHRNTVRQRLRRIAQLTGGDLNDADSRLALHLAILGRQALERLAS